MDASDLKLKMITQTAQGMVGSVELAKKVVECLCSVTPPERRTAFELMTIQKGGRGGGVSVKPGNVLLNIRKLVSAVASGALTVVGSLHEPWIAVLGALAVWDSLYSGLQVELDEAEASVVWTMWLKCDDSHTLPKSGLLLRVNEQRRKFGRREMSDLEFSDVLRKLERMRCISAGGDDDSRWWLREWVRVEFT